MFGNLEILERAKVAPSSGASFGAESFIAAQTSNGLTSAVLPLRLYTQAWNALEQSIEDATDEDAPVPSAAALQRAKFEISTLAMRLVKDAAAGRRPVIASSVTHSGSIEIVGYYHGVLGRYTVRIDRDGTMCKLTATKWPIR